MPRYVVRRTDDVSPAECPCGQSRRAITCDDNSAASVHVVAIARDSKRHYHKRLTEFYYVLEGRGQMLLDDDAVDIEPGMVIMIPPGVVHAARGRLKIVNMVVPPFDPADEFIVD